MSVGGRVVNETEKVILESEYKDGERVPVNVDGGVVVYILTPERVTVGPFSATRSSKGVYQYEYYPAKFGKYSYQFQSTDGTVISEKTFNVKKLEIRNTPPFPVVDGIGSTPSFTFIGIEATRGTLQGVTPSFTFVGVEPTVNQGYVSTTPSFTFAGVEAMEFDFEDETLFMATSPNGRNLGGGTDVTIGEGDVFESERIYQIDPDGTITELFDFADFWGDGTELKWMVLDRPRFKLYLLYEGNELYVYDLKTGVHSEYYTFPTLPNEIPRFDVMETGTYGGYIFFVYAFGSTSTDMFRLNLDDTVTNLGYFLAQTDRIAVCREETQQVYGCSSTYFQVRLFEADDGAQTTLIDSQFGSSFGPAFIHHERTDKILYDQAGSGGKVIIQDEDGNADVKQSYGWGGEKATYSPSNGRLYRGGNPMTYNEEGVYDVYYEPQVKKPGTDTLITTADMGSYGVNIVEAW